MIGSILISKSRRVFLGCSWNGAWGRSIRFLCLAGIVVWASEVRANPQIATPERMSQWIAAYHLNPEPKRLGEIVHAMRDLGLFRDQRKAGFFIGFIAGVLGDNQLIAEKLVADMFPMPPKEQAIIIRAIAYSGLPEWREILEKFSERMPLRGRLIERFLRGEEKVLMELPLHSDPGVIDTLWGYYAATGYREPVVRIISTLKWAKSKKDITKLTWRKFLSSMTLSGGGENLDRLTIGSMAKWTLASNAERDRRLMDLYRLELSYQPKSIVFPLKDVVAAAEDFEAERIRDDARLALEEAKRRAPDPTAGWSRAAYAGSVALSTACIVANVAGHPEVGAGCVITGALYSGAVKMLNRVSNY